MGGACEGGMGRRGWFEMSFDFEISLYVYVLSGGGGRMREGGDGDEVGVEAGG